MKIISFLQKKFGETKENLLKQIQFYKAPCACVSKRCFSDFQFLTSSLFSQSYKEKDAGKVVLYTTTMGIVRSTYQRCNLVKKILRNLLVKYEERDVFMSTEYQDEIRDRMKSDEIRIPQLFVDGHYVGVSFLFHHLSLSLSTAEHRPLRFLIRVTSNLAPGRQFLFTTTRLRTIKKNC